MKVLVAFTYMGCYNVEMDQKREAAVSSVIIGNRPPGVTPG